MKKPDAEFREGLIGSIPHLRAFAMALCGNSDRADDLVQECLERAWANNDKFERGSNLRAWLFTITRNAFYTDLRKRKREVEDADGQVAGRVAVRGAQEGAIDLTDLIRALGSLSAEQREVLILIGASGLSYEATAEICNLPIGTIKSRVSRARERLASLMGLSSADDIGIDAAAQAVIGQMATIATIR